MATSKLKSKLIHDCMKKQFSDIRTVFNIKLMTLFKSAFGNDKLSKHFWRNLLCEDICENFKGGEYAAPSEKLLHFRSGEL